MSDAVDHGITVTEIAAMDQPVDACPETTAAFVGRALRGPLNTPVLVTSFAEFRRRFGDVWTHSSLGPAARQFFDHGGMRLFVVRVASNARGAMLCLPASGSALVLRAVEPGSTESIRAAIDYDAIGDEEADAFNLTLQRVDPSSGLIIDQEFFRRLSWREDDERFVADELLSSTLARAEQPHPMHRPEATLSTGARFVSTYIDHSQAGTDGIELSDYDLVGSRAARSGIFALQQLQRFDLLYLPAPAQGVDAGPAAILAAELYCRERRAMLIVDPAAEWENPQDAVDGVRSLGFASPNMLSYFPRLRERKGEKALRAGGGALAGLLCKQDRTHGAWQRLDGQGMGLHRAWLPAVDINADDEKLLARAGLNAVMPGDAGRACVNGIVTLGPGSAGDRQFSRLPVRRFCLQIVNTIENATRWAVFEAVDARLAQRIRGQILTYLHCLNDLGAFVNDQFVVDCDAGVSDRLDAAQHGITIQLGFHPYGSESRISLTLHQTPAGCRVGSTAFPLAAASVD